ncbi:hypothetical protein [Pseudonocardia sp. HH130630-07]|nr:hypothetical protein [Pseudonocardia sp. HH130630-07]
MEMVLAIVVSSLPWWLFLARAVLPGAGAGLHRPADRDRRQ